jgi:hypothetical protein
MFKNPTDHAFNPPACKKGRKLYEEFGTVVVLTVEMRITDPVWQHRLTNLRKGHVQSQDIDMLHELIIGQSLASHRQFRN